MSFLIWPFGTMIAAFNDRKKYWAKDIFWLFCTYFGFTFIISDENLDSARYAIVLSEFHESGLRFGDIIRLLYSTGSEYIDIVQPILTYLTAIFTDNPAILFSVFAFVFGFFYSRNIWYILDRINGKITIEAFVFILAYILICPIWFINGIRMYAAAQVFIFGLMPYIFEGNKKNLIWSFGSVFFHFSFVFPVLILFSYMLIRNRPVFFFVFSLITLFISEINLEVFRGLFSFLPGFMQSRISYFDAEGARGLSELRQELSWYLKFSEQAVKLVGYAFTIVIFSKGKSIFKNNPEMLNLLSFSLWIYGWSNLARLIPSGGRFTTVADMIMMTFLIFFITKFYNDKVYKYLNIIAIPVLLLFIIVSLRIGADMCGFYAILGNPIIAGIYKDTVPVIEFVKEIF